MSWDWPRDGAGTGLERGWNGPLDRDAALVFNGAMHVNGQPFRSLRFDPALDRVEVIDQRRLPHQFRLETLESLESFETAIRDMWVRGAPLIGATAAWGIAREMGREASDPSLARACARLLATRPTAINLRWALERMQRRLLPLPPAARAGAARDEAIAICDEDVRTNEAIGTHGLALLRQRQAERQAQAGDEGRSGRRGSDHRPPGPPPLQVLTHCNAGWLATVDWGTATAPIYLAHQEGLDLHVWVDETRPRNQGAALTCWELGGAGVPHTLIVDNAGGHLMQQGLVDLVIVGADRVTARGDVCNKIGTYLKALAAFDNNVPFYAAVPVSTIDWATTDGLSGVPIEVRDGREVTEISGFRDGAGLPETLRIAPPGTVAHNPAFDVTPARLVTGLITEMGVIDASPAGLADLLARLQAAGHLP